MWSNRRCYWSIKKYERSYYINKSSFFRKWSSSKSKIFKRALRKNDIIVAPYPLKKSEMVISNGNILVDDSIANLNDWYEHGGIPIYFNKDNLDIDSWGIRNEHYIKIRTLEELRNLKF